MFVHIGQDFIVPIASILLIFDMDTATTSRYTRAFIARLEREQKVISLFDDLPKSAILCITELGEQLYISQISSRVLAARVDRVKNGIFS